MPPRADGSLLDAKQSPSLTNTNQLMKNVWYHLDLDLKPIISISIISISFAYKSIGQKCLVSDSSFVSPWSWPIISIISILFETHRLENKTFVGISFKLVSSLSHIKKITRVHSIFFIITVVQLLMERGQRTLVQTRPEFSIARESSSSPVRCSDWKKVSDVQQLFFLLPFLCLAYFFGNGTTALARIDKNRRNPLLWFLK